MSRNHYMLITLAIYVSISYTPSRSEICSQTVSKNVSMVVSIKVSSKEIYKTVCHLWDILHFNCTRDRLKYSIGYVIRYQPINETRYINCAECSDWEFAENLCESCGNCQPCRCNRTNSKSCQKRDGSCNCNRGWQGKTCDNRCERGTYGENCMQECHCNMTNTMSCNHLGGECRCKPGWIGTMCNQACESWYFGDNCSKSCLCDKENTLFCSHDDGICHCKPGWEGTACNETNRCSKELTNKTESWPICAKHSDTSRTLNDAAMAGIIVSVLLVSAILTIITVCIKRKHLNRRKMARSDDVSYQVTSRQRVYVKGLEDQGQGQDVPYYASVLTNPTLEQGRTTAPTEGPYACLEEFDRGTYMTVQKSEEKCSEMEAHYEAVEPVTEVTVLHR